MKPCNSRLDQKWKKVYHRERNDTLKLYQIVQYVHLWCTWSASKEYNSTALQPVSLARPLLKGSTNNHLGGGALRTNFFLRPNKQNLIFFGGGGGIDQRNVIFLGAPWTNFFGNPPKDFFSFCAMPHLRWLMVEKWGRYVKTETHFGQ